MKAVIMAGGEGARLRPLTDGMPKPLVPVAGRPALCYVFDSLLRCGIRQAALTVRYRADDIIGCFGESYGKLSLRYYREEEPLGTAGGVAAAADFFAGDDDLLVLSGDAVTEIDLGAAIRFHRRRAADATLVLTEVSEPLEYGVALCGVDGSVIRFIEKPAWPQAVSDTVNTGIYVLRREVLDLIPRGESCDFARQLFPAMLRGGLRVYGYEAPGYWCDIGDIDSYIACNLRYSGGGSAIDTDCAIADSAVVRNSVLLGGVTVGEGSVVDGALLCRGVTVGRGCTVSPGAALGEGASVCDGASVRAGARHAPGSQITADSADAVWEGDLLRLRADGADAVCRAGRVIAAALAASADAPHGLRVSVVSIAENAGRGILSGDIASVALCCGLADGGCRVTRLSGESDSMALYEAVTSGGALTVSVACRAGGNGADAAREVLLTLRGGDGAFPARAFERELTRRIRSNSPAPTLAGGVIISEPQGEKSLSGRYRAALREVAGDMSAFSFSVVGSPCLADALHDAGSHGGAERRLGVVVTSRRGLIVTEGADAADFWHVCAAILAVSGDKAVLPADAPAALSRYAADGPAAAVPLWLRDPCFAAARLAALLRDSGKRLGEALEGLPSFRTLEHTVTADGALKCRAMRLGEPAVGEGVTVSYSGRGVVRLIPERGHTLRVISEAVSAEAAEEILALSDEKLRHLAHRDTDITGSAER